MTDENTGANPQAQASSAEQTIPKARLDEVLARSKMLEEQVRFQQQMLTQSQQRQPAQPNPDQQKLMRLREENPELYKAEVEKYKLKQELSQTKQAVAGLWDAQDRMQLVSRYGKTAEKRADEVEQTLEQFRNQGNYSINREQVLVLLLGQDKLREDQARALAPVLPVVLPSGDDDMPGSNPSSASALVGGKAPSSGSNKSFAEIEKDLSNIEF